jgi:hypothetical protein
MNAASVTPVSGEAEKKEPSTVYASVNCRLREAVTSAGMLIREPELIVLVKDMEFLCMKVTESIISQKWNRTDIMQLASGKDYAGKPLPKKGKDAAAKLKWVARSEDLDGAWVSKHTQRIGQEYAVRLLRGSGHTLLLTDAILESWPVDPSKRTVGEWATLRGLLEGYGVDPPTAHIRNRTSAIINYVSVNAGLMPQCVTDMEDPPKVAPVLILGATDSQEMKFTRIDKDRAYLTFRVPSSRTPKSRFDWHWVHTLITMPPTIPGDAVLHIPNLRLKESLQPDGTTVTELFLDLSFDRVLPKMLRSGKPKDSHHRAVGFDWGVNTPMSGARLTLDEGTHGETAVIRMNSQPVYHPGGGILGKLTRLRLLSELLDQKIKHIQRLLGPDDGTVNYGAGNPDTFKRLLQLKAEHSRVNCKRRNLNKAFARAIAHWMLDYAVQEGATIIYIENLKAMRSGGLGKRQCSFK